MQDPEGSKGTGRGARVRGSQKNEGLGNFRVHWMTHSLSTVPKYDWCLTITISNANCVDKVSAYYISYLIPENFYFLIGILISFLQKQEGFTLYDFIDPLL